MSRQFLSALFIVVWISVPPSKCDFQCVCNYNIETAVFANPGEIGSPFGYMYEFDCKPEALSHIASTGHFSVQFEGKLGYIAKDSDRVQIQTCPGNPSSTDIIPTTTSKPDGHSTPSTHVTAQQEKTTTTTTSMPSSTSTRSIPSSTTTTTTSMPSSTTKTTTSTPSSTTTTTMPSSTTTTTTQMLSISTATTTLRTTTMGETTTPFLYWTMAANVSGTPLQYVGVGYNVLTGNPLSTRDPGLLLNKRILQLTGSPSNVREASVTLSQQCASTITHTLVHGSLSLQEEMKRLVKLSDSHGSVLKDYGFTMSSDFSSQRRFLDAGQSLYHDTLTTCAIGSVRYFGNSARPNGNFTVSHEFAKAVCKLPIENRSTEAFMTFFDEWGTSVVMAADLGSISLSRTTETLPEVFKRISTWDPSLLLHGGRMGSFSSSWTIDATSYRSNSRPIHSQVPQNVVMKVGSTFDPVAVSLNIVSISDIIKPEYFRAILWSLIEERSCPDNVDASYLEQLSQIVANMTTLYTTHTTKNNSPAVTDYPLQVPVTWPHGTYGLMKTASGTGCPAAGATWNTGLRYQDTEDSDANSQFTSGIGTYMAGSFDRSHIQTEFCMKVHPEGTPYDVEWPAGAYCILKKNSCPLGFNEGSIFWDDEYFDNHNHAGGYLPDGSYGSSTRIYYCCRNDGATSTPITLPIDHPFILIRYGTSCQAVNGMNLQNIFIRWYDDDLSNDDSASGMHPYDDGGSKDHRLYFCYYDAGRGTSIIG
ncbi:uncharacterized protein LOC127872229 [Dreissena polymorpha]|uniref:Apextrin C-terminal domain-containing protein n=1 Tax=Dreissena polymorpha TaxID=45954 RepID=A0A9D4RQD1_DREPO|nr:uncharacterized protein LOC127872229 [Dreissena polymorpha]KAH3877576.1 hypothetical protein DPMN_001451 [Dreissena polymorpha]